MSRIWNSCLSPRKQTSKPIDTKQKETDSVQTDLDDRHYSKNGEIEMKEKLSESSSKSNPDLSNESSMAARSLSDEKQVSQDPNLPAGEPLLFPELDRPVLPGPDMPNTGGLYATEYLKSYLSAIALRVLPSGAAVSQDPYLPEGRLPLNPELGPPVTPRATMTEAEGFCPPGSPNKYLGGPISDTHSHVKGGGLETRYGEPGFIQASSYYMKSDGNWTPSSFPPDVYRLDDIPRKTKLISKFHDGKIVSAVVIRNDNKYAFLGGQGSVNIWKIAYPPKPDMIWRLHCLHQDSYVRSVKLLSDYRTLIVGGESSTLEVWDLVAESPILKGKLDFPATCLYGLAISPDNKLCVGCGSDGNVAIWDLHNQQRVSTFQAHTGNATCIAISSDGTTLSTGGFDKFLRSWDFRNPRLLVEQYYHSRIISMDYSPSGDWLALGMGDSSIEVFNATNTDRFKLLLHNSLVLSLKFSSNGNWLVSTGTDDLLSVWRAPYGPSIFQMRWYEMMWMRLTIEMGRNHRNDFGYDQQNMPIPPSRLYHQSSRFPEKLWFLQVFPGMEGLIFISSPKMRINSDTYIDLLQENLLPDCTNLYPEKKILFQQDVATSHTSKRTQEFLEQCTTFMRKTGWSPHSPNCNPMDYSIWNNVLENLFSGRNEKFSETELKEKLAET